MADKFGRIYDLKVETSTHEVITISDPFTLEFTITRNNMAHANTASFVIYNLSETTRKKIFKDQFDMMTHRYIQLYAGYQDQSNVLVRTIPQCFNGEVRWAYSYRRAQEFRTEIDCYDGGTSLSNGHVSLTLPAGLTQDKIIAMLMAALPNIKGMTIGTKFLEQAKRGISLFGNPAELLKQITNDKFYIDNGKAFAIDNDEAIRGEILVIDSSMGLLGTPKRSEAFLELQMIFEPRITVGQLVKLVSSTGANFNAIYKVTGVSHRGTISGAVCGEATTTVSLLAGTTFRVVG